MLNNRLSFAPSGISLDNANALLTDRDTMTEHDEMTVGEEQTEDEFMRRIRSFVRREGRLT